MKTRQFFLYLAIIVLALASCKPEEKPPVISYVFTDVAVEAGQTSATITCRNESVDDDKVHASVLLSRNENITDATKYPLHLQNDTLCGNISGLEPNTIYYFCFEVYTANEHKRTEEVHHFETTGGGNVTVTTSEAINITQTSATGGGNVTADGNYAVTMRGVCWDTVSSPNALMSPHLQSGEGTGTFLVNITGLRSGRTYYMKAYAVSNDVVYYGNEVHFTTQSAQLPTVTTGEVSNITRTTAQASGNVTNDGGADVTRRGVCWSTAHEPSVDDDHADNGTGTGAYTVDITELTSNTTYYVRAYAENAAGLSYGEEVEFTTAEDITAPIVVTGEMEGTTAHGEVTSDGGADVTERGICWGTEHTPTTEGTHATSGTGTGSFSVELTDLDPGTTYYVRAYAKNSQGTSYGNEVNFSTEANKPTVTTSEVSNITQTTAQGGGDVTDDGGLAVTERGICWGTSHNPTTGGSHATSGEGTGSYICNMTGLTQNTTYYVRAYATNAEGTSYGDEVSFKTSQNISAPTVTTGEVTNITQTSAKCSGNVTADGGATVTERGICWGTSHNPTVTGSHASSGTGTGTYTCNMTGLTAGTIYYVRAYAKNSQGTSYGSEVSFSTTANKPTVTTSTVTNVAQTSAQGGGNVTATGGATVTARGICWSTSHNPTISGSHAAASSGGTGSYTVNMTGLTANTTYYVRAYATNSAGTAYGSEVSFTTTQNVTLPTVTTSQVTNVAQTTATGGGNVTATGNGTVTARGICWSTSHNPTISGSHGAASSGGTGSYTVNMTGLTANTTYYVRAYATNSAGTAYGSEVSFTTTQNVTLPTVTTSQVTSIAQTTATGGGNVTATGGATVTARGICWSTSHNPTISGSHAAASSGGTGSYTVNMTGLTANTTYYVRAYATNSAGTAYGSEVSFTTTQNVTLPTVTTSQVTSIAQTTATGGGNVTATGGATVTARGICWSTSHNPTISGSHAAASSGGTGSYTVNMTGLTANTTYYVRAYATNSAGTAYGSEVSFTTTQNVTLPTVTTSQVTSIAQTTATGGGNVTATGGATVTARGICWGTSHNPTISGSHAAASSGGTGSYTVNMTGLTANTTYYVRAYATNSAGTAYGSEVSFTTMQNVTLPTVTTSQVTSIAQTTATGGGNVTATGNGTVTARGICWSTSHNPTVSGSHAAASSGGTGSYTVNMTGLTANTTYYVRAYATNSAGTAYGSEVSFTTMQNVTLPTVTTSQVTSIAQTTATGGGNVTADGNATVTARGICWSTSHNPTISGSHAAASSGGTGSYTVNMTGLTANTTYYVRAYATNSAGTAYGSEVSFTTTQNVTLPTVTTSQVTSIAQTTATGGGNVTADGNATVMERGICWSTSHDPTTSSSHASSGTGTGSYTVNMTGLTANTTYYVRAYATNSAGTAYGSEVSFTTTQNVTLPTVTTSQVTSIAQTTATSGGNVTADGNATVTERGICWSTSHNPTTSSSHVSSGTGTGSYTVNMTGLTANTTYYVRAYATNSAGTAYGSEVSFTTLSSGGSAPTGAINGLFSVSATQQVYFSQGNLQYKASTNTWKFAENQYDYVGNANSNISSTYSGWIDLFGWGTSGYNHGAVCYQPWSISLHNDYYAYGSDTYNLYDQTGQADWGYNSISNGGNTQNQWRTLTKDEWGYVFNTRTTPSGIRYAKANVNNVNGVILLPDDWNSSYYSLNSPNTSSANFNSNTITSSQWTALEQHGAVFLPAIGYRRGTSILDVGSIGYYWSASCYMNCSADNVLFDDGRLFYNAASGCYFGYSVRLVCPAQ
ncbi:MAG: hypothetical protein K6G25_12960 [Bacteroidales bacterium]|nr:hypothetical protein [Bacteroidales bacterium]